MSTESQNDGPIKGSCLSMCPPEECISRQRNKLVHPLECRPNSDNTPKTTQLLGASPLFVKEFARSSAGREIVAKDVRPLAVLNRTVRYLLTQAYLRTDYPNHVVHEFISDRLRAVRQDLAVQELLTSTHSTALLASIVRFYVLQQYRMCEYSLTQFNPVLNMKQLQETLAGLIRTFKDNDESVNIDAKKDTEFSFDLDDHDFFSVERCSSEADQAGASVRPRFEGDSEEMANIMKRINSMAVWDEDEPSSHSDELETEPSSQKTEKEKQNKLIEENSKSENDRILKNPESEECNREESTLPNSPNQHQFSEREEMEAVYLLLNYDNSEVIQHCLELPQNIKIGELLSKILPVILNFNSSGNYIPLIRLLKSLPSLLSVVLYLNLPKIQKKAIEVLSCGHSSANSRFGLEELTNTLMFVDNEAARNSCKHYGLKCVGEQNEFIVFNRKDFMDQPIVPLCIAPWLEARLKALPLQNLLIPHS